jgi:hypothetical protein
MTAQISLGVADILAIHQLLALYGHVLDERQWTRVEELFTADAIYDMRDFDMGVVQGAQAIRELWQASKQHPLAHHATNIVIERDVDGTVRAISKGLGVGNRGAVGSVVYRDIVRPTPSGWRFASRTAVLRRPEAKPPAEATHMDD